MLVVVVVELGFVIGGQQCKYRIYFFLPTLALLVSIWRPQHASSMIFAFIWVPNNCDVFWHVLWDAHLPDTNWCSVQIQIWSDAPFSSRASNFERRPWLERRYYRGKRRCFPAMVWQKARRCRSCLVPQWSKMLWKRRNSRKMAGKRNGRGKKWELGRSCKWVFLYPSRNCRWLIWWTRVMVVIPSSRTQHCPTFVVVFMVLVHQFSLNFGKDPTGLWQTWMIAPGREELAGSGGHHCGGETKWRSESWIERDQIWESRDSELNRKWAVTSSALFII